MKQDTVCLVYHSGGWRDETARVRTSAGVHAHRGLQDEGSTARPGRLQLTFDNRDGWALPTNPVSPFYSGGGQYVPLLYAVRPRLTTGGGADVTDPFTRVDAGSWGATPAGQPYSTLTIAAGGSGAVNGTAATHSIGGAMSARGDLLQSVSMLDGEILIEGIAAPQATGGELEVAGAMYRMQTAAVYGMVRMHITTGNAVVIKAYRAANQAQIGTWTTGITHTGTGQPLSMRVLVVGRRIAVKVWVTAGAEPSTWQQEWTDTSSILSGWVGIRTGRGAGNTNAGVTATYAAWSATQWDVLHSGEIHSWTPHASGNFDVSNWWAGTVGTVGDAWTEVESAGILHRLNAGRDPLRTVAFRKLSRKSLVAYWPMEDRAGPGIVSATTTGTTMNVVTGEINYARDELAAWLGNTVSGTGALVQLDGYLDYPVATSLGVWIGGFLFSGLGLTSQIGVQFVGNNWTSPATNRTDFTLQLNGAAGAGGRIQLYRLTATSTTTTSTTLVDTDAPWLFDGSFHLIELGVQDAGADLNWFVLVDGVTFASGILSPLEYTTPKRVFIAGSGPFTMGHLFVDDSVGFDSGMWTALSGYVGETPADRVIRLGGEEGIAVDVVGNYSDTMGPQHPDTLVKLLSECARTNDAMLYEPASWTGLAMRTREGMYNQPPAAIVSYAGGSMTRVLPVIDTRGTGNDVTIANRDGREWQQDTAAAAISRVQLPAVDTNYSTVSGLAQLQRRAEWELAEGALTGARYPALTFDLGTSPELSATVGRADIARQISVSGLEADTVYQVVRAVSHRVGSHTRTLTIQGTDATLWRPGVWDSARWDSASSTTTGSPLPAATSFFVTTTNPGDLWTTNPAHFPFDIIVGGEVITVTGVVNTTSPQQFTGLVRSVNGIVKQHPAGTPVRVFRPGRYAL